MKYITYLNFAELADIRVFSDMEYHKDVAAEMGSRGISELLGAGFIVSGKCTGVSESLNMDSRGDEDTKVYKRMVGGVVLAVGDYPKGRTPQRGYKKMTGKRKQDKVQRGKDWLQLLKDSGLPMKVSKTGRVIAFPDPKSYYKKYKTKFHLKNGLWVRGLNVLGDPENRTFTGGAEEFIKWYQLNGEGY